MNFRNHPILLSFVLAVCVRINDGAALPRSAPEGQGVSSAALLKVVQALDEKVEGMHSVMIVRHGKVIAEGWWGPYNSATQHTMFSLSKSFTSTAVGLAVAEGKLSINDTLVSIFPDEVPAEPTANLRGMRIRDLLAMSSGHHDTDIAGFNYSPDNMTATKAFLGLPLPHKPGTHFMYNTPATFMLSASVQKKTGQPILEYLRSRLFEPLGIENPVWETNKHGINLGGTGLHIKTEDIAKFGQLYLQEGQWNGKQLVPKAWVAAATSRQTSNGSSPNSDWEQGYGYQFWRCRNGFYRGDGAFGQFCIVMQEHDTVVAITSGVRDMQGVMNVLWDVLVPELKNNALAADDGAHKTLQTKLASLKLPPQTGSAMAPEAAGDLFEKKVEFPTNDQKLEWIKVIPGRGTTLPVLAARVNGKDVEIRCANGDWSLGRFAFGTMPEQAAAGSYAWVDGILIAKIAFYESPYVLTLRVKPDGKEVAVEQEFNVGFGQTRIVKFSGKTL